MKTRYTVVLSMIAGAAVGGTAIQGLHAQAKPKAYTVSELEILDAAANDAFVPLIQAAQKAAGGRPFRTAGGRVVAFQGTPPMRVAITEWDSMEQVEAYQNSAAFKDLAPQRDKAIKITRSYAVEAAPN